MLLLFYYWLLVSALKGHHPIYKNVIVYSTNVNFYGIPYTIINSLCNCYQLLPIQGKFWKYIHSTDIIKFQHNLPQTLCLKLLPIVANPGKILEIHSWYPDHKISAQLTTDSTFKSWQQL
jgi:hypothetical protein